MSLAHIRSKHVIDNLQGSLLRKRMERALDEGDIQTNIHTEFTEALRAQHPDKIVHAQERIRVWEASDKSKLADADCPYYFATQGVSQSPHVASA